MPTSAEAVYLDSSALVKLAIVEAESRALKDFLSSGRLAFSSIIARVEVRRAVGRHGQRALVNAGIVLARTNLVRLEDQMVDTAGTLPPATLRSLDAIHLASALTLGPALIALVTYDDRLARAATALGLEVVAPS
ncbi:MAG: type II toxin-antitoxin system VapC family toxin [Acidimicrobiales bacterium]